MLHGLRLKNFKKHSDLQIEFKEGLNLIVGPNYSGKSSILEGIAMALKGPRAVPGGTSVLTTWGEAKTEVELSFSINDNQYSVSRSGSSASLSRNGGKIATSASTVAVELKELLGIDLDTFLLLKYSTQGRTEALLEMGAAEMNRMLESISRVSVIDAAFAACSAIVQRCEGGLGAIPELMSEQEAEYLEEWLQAAPAELEKDQAAYAAAEQVSSYWRDEIQRAQQAVKQCKDNNDKRALAERKLQELNFAWSHLEKESKEKSAALSAVSGSGAKRDVLQSKYKEDQALLTLGQRITYELQSQKGVLEEESRSKQELLEKRKKLGPLYGEIWQESESELAEKLQRNAELYEEARKNVAVLTGDLKKAKSSAAESVCYACKRPLDDAHHEDLKDLIESLVKELAVAETHLSEVSAAYRQASEKHATYLKASENRELVQKQISELDTKIAARLEKIAELHEQFNSKIHHMGDLESEVAAMYRQLMQLNLDAAQEASLAAEVVSINQKLADLSNKVEQAQQAAQEIPERQDPQPLENNLGVAIASLEEANKAQLEAYKVYLETKQILAEESEKYRRYRQYAEQRDTLSQEKNVASALAKFLRSNRSKFLQDLWSGVLNKASWFTSSCTGGVVSQVLRGDDGGFLFVENGVTAPVAAASGGQKSLISIGIQLGLADLIPTPMSLLLLDEPTAALDAEHAFSMASVLNQSHGQIVMVTHRQLEAASAATLLSL